MPLDGKRTRRAVLATMGSATGTGVLVGTALAQDDGEPTPSGSRDRSSEGRPEETPTSVTEDGVSIDFESCYVCHVTGDGSNVMFVEADFEYYDSARGSTSHHRRSFWDDLPLTIDGREIAGGLPDTAETPIVGQVEVRGNDYLPLADLTQPAQWECRNDL